MFYPVLNTHNPNLNIYNPRICIDIIVLRKMFFFFYWPVFSVETFTCTSSVYYQYLLVCVTHVTSIKKKKKIAKFRNKQPFEYYLKFVV